MTTNETVKPKGKFLEGLASVILGSVTATDQESKNESVSDFQNSAKNLRSALVSLKTKIEEQKIKIASESNSLKDINLVGTISNKEKSNEVDLKKVLEHSIKMMRDGINALHLKLHTSLTEELLNKNEIFLSELIEQYDGEELENRIRSSITERVFEELGPISWKITLDLMQSSGMLWPEPSGLLPGISKEEHDKVVNFKKMEAESFFQSQKLKQGIESMLGVVTAWKAYPDPSTWLWQEVAIRGVASGIRCELLRVAVDKLRSQADSLRAKANELIEEAMSEIQSLLKSGITSLEEAEKVVKGTDSVVSNLLPELAWQSAREVVEKRAAGFIKIN